jgi:hypothetical protein
MHAKVMTWFFIATLLAAIPLGHSAPDFHAELNLAVTIAVGIFFVPAVRARTRRWAMCPAFVGTL